MQSHEIRKRFLTFFEKRNHAIIPSSPLVPENDSSVLFNTAGMQPLVPYLLGEKHPSGTRLANAQKCVRTNDIEEVGDNTHFTFFEMLGNWSLGDYFKEDAIAWSYEFLTNKEEGLGLDPERLYVSVFEGNDDAPRDNEAAEIWKKLVPENRIYYMGAEDNWWSAGDNGPCGPDSEMFYDRTKDGLGDMTFEEFKAADEKQEVVEIWNDVFMQYLKKDGNVVSELDNKNIDTGAGLERLTAILQDKQSPYETDLFADIISYIEANSERSYADEKMAYRVFADHIRTAVFLISDGALPANKDQGYITRRLVRRAIRYTKTIGMDTVNIVHIAALYIDQYSSVYANLSEKKESIISEIEKEVTKFEKTLTQGLREFERLVDIGNSRDNIAVQEFGHFNSTSRVNEISGEEAFKLFTTYGFPLEMIVEESENRGLYTNTKDFRRLLAELGGDSPKITAFHTCTHLLLAGLRKELGDHVNQAGSNITDERTRFDFTHPEKVDRETLDRIEKYVNDAVGSFWEKYPDVVKVYSIKDDNGVIYSRELCGGPHVEEASQIQEFGLFKIKKESSSSAGVRRIKAIFVQ